MEDYHNLIRDQGEFVMFMRQQLGGDSCPPIFLVGKRIERIAAVQIL